MAHELITRLECFDRAIIINNCEQSSIDTILKNC